MTVAYTLASNAFAGWHPDNRVFPVRKKYAAEEKRHELQRLSRQQYIMLGWSGAGELVEVVYSNGRVITL